MRQESLYYTMVHNWSKQRVQGLLRVGSKASASEKERVDIMAENKQLRRKLEQTEKRLKKVELLVELQKKRSVFMAMDAAKTSERNDSN